MKKLLSVILAIVMVCTFATVAFAASPSIKAGETKSFTISCEDGASVTFTPTKTDIYEVSVKLVSGYGASIDAYNADDWWLSSCSVFNADDMTTGSFHFIAEKGKTVTMSMYTSLSEDDDDMDAKVSVTLKATGAKYLALGKNNVPVAGGTYLFKPTKDGYYNFCSNAAASVDPYINITDSLGYYTSADDNGYENDWNFDCTTYMTTDNLYMVEVGQYDFDDLTTAAYSFKITYDAKKVAESISLSTDKIVTYAGCWEFAYLYVVPTGATCNSGIEAYTDNPDVAFVDCVTEAGEIDITADRVGVTTLHVTTPEGLEATAKIIVLPSFFMSISNFFESARATIINFFYNIFSGNIL